MCCRFRVVTILPFRVLNRASVWAVKIDEEQSTVIFLVPTIFFLFLSLDLKKKVSWLKKGIEMNNVSYYPYSLSVQSQGGDLAEISHFHPGEGGGAVNKFTGRLRSEVQPVTLFVYHFSRKRSPFRVPSIDKYYSFHIPCLELFIPFYCCKWMVV